jgi:hypothetical protein
MKNSPSARPDTVSKAQSHGCVRLTNWDALTLAKMVGQGDARRLHGLMLPASGGP